MPQRLGDFAATGITPGLAPTNDPIPPGKEFNLAKDLFKGLGESTPDAIRDFESFVWSTHTLPDGTVVSSDPADWGNITPGLAIKALGSGCGKGNTALPAGTPNCVR
jgi:hypothetical protein